MLRLALLPLLAAPLAAQSTWYVDSQGAVPGSGTAQDPYSSLRYALAQPSTVDGDEVLVASGTYAERVDPMGKAVSVRHDGLGEVPILMGNGMESSLAITSGEGENTVFEGFEIVGTSGSLVGGILSGGAVLVSGARPTLRNVTVRDSSASRGGGIAVFGGGLVLEQCEVVDCTATAKGGAGVYVEGSSLEILGGRVSDNFCSAYQSSTEGGGVFADEDSRLILRDCEVSWNRTLCGAGGGVYALGPVDLDGVVMRWNRPGAQECSTPGGGGIYGPLAVGRNCLLEHNGSYLTSEGGGAYGGTWLDCEFRDNHAFSRGAGLAYGTAYRSRFVHNTFEGEGDSPTGLGAGAFGSYLERCTLEDNVTLLHGGGAAESDLVDCIVRNNTANWDDWGDGAGLYRGTALRCLIENNASDGVIYCRGGGAFETDLTLCVIAGNSSVTGGGVYGGSLDRCTLVGNRAYGMDQNPGGGSKLASLDSCILWGNVPDATGGGVATYSNVEGGATGVGNIDFDPRFFGPGSDVHLRPASPCRDAGNPSAPLDLDGSQADMGARPFAPGHQRQDGYFCNGSLDLSLAGELSLSGSPAVLTCPKADLFLVSTAGSMTQQVIQMTSSGPGSSICLTGSTTRLLAAPDNTLEFNAALLGQLGFFPGDRLYVQGVRLHSSGQARNSSHGLDLLVKP